MPFTPLTNRIRGGQALAWGGQALGLALASVLLGCFDVSARALYTAGHADIAVDMSVSGGRATWNAFLASHGATVGGESVTGTLSLEDVAVWSSAEMSRPSSDLGAFGDLCVAEGEGLMWLPQGLRDASSFGVPFVGIAASAEPNTLADDMVVIRLVGVQSPSEGGTYALWRDGLPPKFFISSCDGIDAEDRIDVPLGHDHFNMGFSEPGNWTLTYEASAQLTDGEMTSVRFDVHYVLDRNR